MDLGTAVQAWAKSSRCDIKLLDSCKVSSLSGPGYCTGQHTQKPFYSFQVHAELSTLVTDANSIGTA
jgi:hypothetical protein